MTFHCLLSVQLFVINFEISLRHRANTGMSAMNSLTDLSAEQAIKVSCILIVERGFLLHVGFRVSRSFQFSD